MGQLKDDLLSGRLDQFVDGPNWEAIISWIADEFEEVIEAALYLLMLTWLDESEGVWVDRIGDIVGADRPGNEELERVFRCSGADDPTYDPLHGFANSSGTIGGFLSGRWGVPKDGLEDDTDYKEVIKAKIAGTSPYSGDASVPGLARFVRSAYGLDCAVSVVGLRQVRIELDGDYDLRQRRYLEEYAPILAGVELSIPTYPEL
jgi:hypothetical protein